MTIPSQGKGEIMDLQGGAPTKDVIARKLKELRARTGQTQDVIAAKLNMQKSTLANYEAARRLPDLDTLARIARFYHVPLDYFLESPPPWWEAGGMDVPLDLDYLLREHKNLRLFGRPISDALREDIFKALRIVAAIRREEEKKRLANSEQ